MRFWILRELLGVVILLVAIVALPVYVSRLFALQEVPFNTQGIPRDAIKLYPSKGEVRQALVRTVKGQLDALQMQDFSAAWEMAARPMRQHLPVADFERMVKSGFAIMMEPHQLEFGAVFNNPEFGFVDIKLTTAQSGVAYFSYYLVADGGRWFVSGVEPQNPARYQQGRSRGVPGPRAERSESLAEKQGV